MDMSSRFIKALDAFVAGWQAIVDESRGPNDGSIMTDEARRYVRIRYRSSAWAFVDKTNGDILKSASYTSPTKGARANIYDADHGVRCCSAYGIKYLKDMK